jgi:anti-sigma B factor antagonist
MSLHPGQHWLQREDAGSVTVARVVPARLQGEELCRDVFGLLCALVDEAGRTRVVLDLTGVASMDSHAVGGLVLLNRKARAAGGRLAVCCPSQTVAECFERMRLAKVLEVFASREEALSSFPADPLPDEASQGG